MTASALNPKPRRLPHDSGFNQFSDDVLAGILVAKLTALEAEGIQLQEGWRDVRPLTLKFLDRVWIDAVASCNRSGSSAAR